MAESLVSVDMSLSLSYQHSSNPYGFFSCGGGCHLLGLLKVDETLYL
jgi:hypothetical protein